MTQKRVTEEGRVAPGSVTAAGVWGGRSSTCTPTFPRSNYRSFVNLRTGS